MTEEENLRKKLLEDGFTASELERLLSDSSNFKLTVDINAKQEVDFILEKEDENGNIIRNDEELLLDDEFDH